MPVTPEEALSAAMRGTMRAIEAGDIDPQQYTTFLHHSHEAASIARASITRMGEANVQKADEETIGMLQHEGYLRAFQLAVSSLLALTHYPFLDELEHASPGGAEEDIQ